MICSHEASNAANIPNLYEYCEEPEATAQDNVRDFRLLIEVNVMLPQKIGSFFSIQQDLQFPIWNKCLVLEVLDFELF